MATVRLADVTTRIGSGITPRGGSAVYKTSGRPFLRSQNIGWGDLRLDDIAYIDEATHSTFPSTEVRTGDVLLNITGASIGRSAVATPELNGGNVNQHVCEIRLKPGRMDPYFVNAFLLSRAGQDQIDMFQAGGNRQGLNFQQVGSISVPDLDISQQRAIGTAGRDADGMIAALERKIAKKQSLKHGMMQQLLTGRTRLPGFAEDWSLRCLGDVLAVRHGKSQKAVEVSGGKYPVLASGGQIGWAHTPLYTKPSVLIGRKGTIDRPQYQATPFWTVDTLFYTEISQGADPRFLFYVFLTVDWRSMNEASGVPSLSASRVESVRVRLPGVEEQRAIRAVLDDVEAEIALLGRRLSKARAVKTGITQQLLTGRTRLSIGEAVA